MYQIGFYVPETHMEIIKAAMFQAGAGKLGNYDQAAWQTRGIGQYRPLHGSNPYCGEENSFTTVTEYKVEMLCDKECLRKVIQALKQSHPYEEPAYSVIELIKI